MLWLTACALAALAASAVAAGGPPGPSPPVPGWTLIRTGVGGGTVWVGRIPNRLVADTRPSAVYVPPGFDPRRRYPVVYLLHGLPGSPSSFYASLDLADVADAIVAQTHTPFIAVMPVGGPRLNAARGEWAGVWARYVANDVVPWADRHLPTLPARASRALAGLCAGGYGALDIGLRHPALFGTLEAWQGYFAPVFHDGPFAHAPRSVLAANDPTLLVGREAPLLRSLGDRFYVSVGGNHGRVLRRFSLGFDRLLGRYRLPHTLWLLPQAEQGHFWRATLPSAVAYAVQGFAGGRPH